MIKCDFSYSHYQDTLKKIKKTHEFTNFVDCSDNDIILRHDVDISLSSALKMAKIEKNLGIKSTFFILFQAELYNPFSTDSTSTIKEILKMGHHLGLHFDSSFIIKNKLDPSETIKKEIEIMEQHYNTEIKVISPHDPGVSMKLSLKLPKGVFNAFSEPFIKNRKYLSDSVQNWREGCFCQHFENYDRLQVLVHPIWWSTDAKSRKEITQILHGGEDNYQKDVDYLAKKYDNYMTNINSKIDKT